MRIDIYSYSAFKDSRRAVSLNLATVLKLTIHEKQLNTLRTSGRDKDKTRKDEIHRKA